MLYNIYGNLIANQPEIYQHFHTYLLDKYQLLLQVYIYPPFFLLLLWSSLSYKIYLQKEILLLLKGLDLVLVQPFIDVTVGNMLDLIYLVL